MSLVSISTMTNPLVALAPRRPSRRRVAPISLGNRREDGGRRGRAWINGHEVGGTEARLAHLSVGHD